MSILPLVFVRPAAAQVTRSYSTLEGRIHTARIVVRGHIAGFERTVLVPPMGKRDGSVWPDGIVRYTLRVVPAEVLKGGRRRALELTRETSGYDHRFEEWRDAKTPFLWFVHDSPAPFQAWDALRLGPPVPSESHYTTDAPPIFSLDLTVLQDREHVVRRARAFAAADETGSTETRTISISRSLADRCAASADGNLVLLPVHPQLEAAARQLVEHPERSLGRDERRELLPELRRIGLEELRGFPSPRNRRLLRSVADGSGPPEERELARHVLEEWVRLRSERSLRH